MPLVAAPRGRKQSWAQRFVAAALENRYAEQVGALSQVPKLKVPLSDIVGYKLDARMGFLLAAVDGNTSFEDIVDLSNMSRCETLGLLAQLLHLELIECSSSTNSCETQTLEHALTKR